jgi:hypothetical protein
MRFIYHTYIHTYAHNAGACFGFEEMAQHSNGSSSNNNNDRQRVAISKFHPEKQIHDYAAMLFAGPKNSGKSWCARYVAYCLKDRVYDATVFTGSMEEKYPWNLFVPDEFVFNGFHEDMCGEIMDRQEKRVEIADRTGVSYPGHMIIWEDLEYMKKNIFNSEIARKMMLNGRHFKLYPMALVQYIMKGLTLEVRSMFDFAFFTKEPNAIIRNKIWKIFGGVCTTFDEFDTIFRMCTEDYRVLVIKRGNSYDIAENFFYMKTPDMGVFHIGHADFWAVSSAMREYIKQKALRASQSSTAQVVITSNVIQKRKRKQRGPGADDDGDAAADSARANISVAEAVVPTISAYSAKAHKTFEIDKA